MFILSVLALRSAEGKDAAPVAEETFIPAVKWSGLLQFWNQVSDNKWDQTFHYVRLKATALVDPQTKVLVMPVLGTNTNFTLLDAFVQRDLGNDWTLTGGQFKFAFGDDRVLFPDQLKRVDYAKMDKFAFPGNPWDMGFKVKKVFGDFTVLADVIQGAGPNVLKDNDNFKDISTRLEWKTGEWLIGGSYYGGTGNTTGFITYQSWFGAHARYSSGGFDARAEGIWAPLGKNAYLVQTSYRSGDLEPLAWGELGLMGASQNYQLLGAGINYWVAKQTRLSLNGTLNGRSDFSGPALVIFQIEQTF